MKVEELVYVFLKGKFELLSLTQTKLKRYGEVSWCGVNDIIAGVQAVERTREAVAVLSNDVWHSTVIDFGCVSLESYGLRSSFQGLKYLVVVGYDPTEGDVKQKRGSGMTWTGLWIE